jgi:5-methylcytosine-specific restriction endonuclease McrA
MKRPRISNKLRAKIAAEARYRCGYCLMQQIAANWLLEVEHIIPTALGGTDDEENLWLSCTACNRYKGTQVNELRITNYSTLQACPRGMERCTLVC